MKRLIIYSIVIILLSAWLITGFYTVSPKHTAVTTFLGKISDSRVAPGLHYRAPWPIGRVYCVETSTIFNMPVGFRITEMIKNKKPTADQCEWLTGDTNVLRIQLLIQYVISNPKDFLFSAVSQFELLRKAGEASVTHRLGQMTVDDALTIGWALLSKQVMIDVQQHLDKCNAGLTVISLQRKAIEPPEEVRKAFQDITNARQDKSRFITKAMVYQEQVLPRARGRAHEIISNAIAKKDQRISFAKGDMNRFLALLPQVKKSPESIRVRYYREIMEKILPSMKKRILVRSADGSLIPINIFQN